MSRYISNLNVAEFDRDVKQEYAQKPQLRQLVTLRTGVVGESYRFQKSSQGIANKKVYQSDAVLMNVQYDKVKADLTDWEAPELSDVFNAPKINFNERAELVKVSSQAIGRREDQIILDVLKTAKDDAQALTTADGGVGMTTAKFRDAMRQLNYYNADGPRAFVMGTQSLYDMLGEDTVTTVDRNIVKALVDGELKQWLGFRIYTVGFMKENGLSVTADIKDNYAFVQNAVGHAVGINMRTEINYIALKASWLVNTLFSAGGVVIDAHGIVTVYTDEA